MELGGATTAWIREVDLGLVATDAPGLSVIGPCSLLGCVEGAKPDAHPLFWVPYFSRPFAPRPLPYPSVLILPLLAVL